MIFMNLKQAMVKMSNNGATFGKCPHYIDVNLHNNLRSETVKVSNVKGIENIVFLYFVSNVFYSVAEYLDDKRLCCGLFMNILCTCGVIF